MSNRIAIVTGAARGIGLATTKLFLEHDWQVAMVDRDEAELQLASANLASTLPIVCDVSIPDRVQEMTSKVLATFGRIDALINNAGVAVFEPLEKTDFDIWRTIMATNLDGVFLCSQAVIPALKESQGSIVNIASISALRASTLRVAYGTSKAAVVHLTKQLAIELGDYGVRVNCVSPGPVKTKLAEAVHSPEIIKAYYDGIPLNRSATEQDIAETVVFLCSPKASYITGQMIAVDGGFDASGIGLPALRALRARFT
ncbi:MULTISPECIES: SDR family oxidoreductase [unclassified Spirosoma]|uniref:SDR family NAD(P)-dependent oxidoreductase n=1 Tax=unclassified Spirosoma TaxID=2621999 RepID=UPI00095991FC|nr:MULTISPECIES: SDR family oxidoreductase [unclassified Spirosoma]MBN8825191.1 SDR family oxidoreductase [Spirosoma sp.]OJW77129.1 MAG: 3-oxoacyl-ACP reductase [Spirosoma sp. 48-14]